MRNSVGLPLAPTGRVAHAGGLAGRTTKSRSPFEGYGSLRQDHRVNGDCGSGEFVPPLRGVDYFGEVEPGFRLRFILSPQHAKTVRAGGPEPGLSSTAPSGSNKKAATLADCGSLAANMRPGATVFAARLTRGETTSP